MNKVLVVFFFLAKLHTALAQSSDTFAIQFELNDARLNKSAKDQIDQLIFKDKLIHGNKFLIYGYADYVGGSGYNEALSRARAKNVLAYLVEMGFNKEAISVCIGKGKIERLPVNGAKGMEADRRVEIIVAPEAPRPMPVKKLTELKPNETMALRNLNFYPGSPVLSKTSLPELDVLLKTLSEHIDINIRIEGHVCCMGPKERIDSPDLLSLRRAATVFRYLAENGISKSRMSFVGLGNKNPVVKEEVTEADRVLNRRVEIRVLSKARK